MLVQNENHSLGAKIADLGTAVKLASPSDKVTDPTGTTGYAGEFSVNSGVIFFVLMLSCCLVVLLCIVLVPLKFCIESLIFCFDRSLFRALS
jgi:hypothetical protein